MLKTTSEQLSLLPEEDLQTFCNSHSNWCMRLWRLDEENSVSLNSGSYFSHDNEALLQEQFAIASYL